VMSVKHGFGVDLAQDALLALARQWPTALKLSVVPLITSFLGSMAIVGAFIALQFNIPSQPAFPYEKRDFLVTFIAIALTLQFAIGTAMVPLMSGWCRHILGQSDNRWIRFGHRELQILLIWSLCDALILALVSVLGFGVYQLLEDHGWGGFLFILAPAGLPLLLVVFWLFYLIALPLIVCIPLLALGLGRPLRTAMSVAKQNRLRLSGAMLVVTTPILFLCASTENDTIDLIFIAVLTVLISGIVSIFLRDESGVLPRLAMKSDRPTPPSPSP
jgi:hypothetical protein